MSTFIRLRALAEDYSRGLSEGSEIVDGEEADFARPFHHILGGLLAQRGLVLAKTARGEVVKVAPWVRPAPVNAKYPCRHCGHSIFVCPHSPGVVVVGIWPDAEALLRLAVPAMRTTVRA